MLYQEGVPMKLIYAIVRSDDDSRVIEALNKQSYSVTKLATTGGFLKSGNTTLIIGTEQEKVDEVIHIIKTECGNRKRMVVTSPPILGSGSSSSLPVTVDIGGATIFVMDVERFEKI